MVNRIFILISFILLLCSPIIQAADTSTAIFDKRFKTLKIEVADDFMAPPAIRMGTDDRIIIKFDEIGEDNSWLEYRLIHCNADWQPSRLIESEYLSGFNSQKIEDFAFSSATFVHYVNYLISLPNENVQFLHSGNFLLQVYDPDSSDRTLLQIRFQVFENSTNITGEVGSRTDMGHNTVWQQANFAVDCSGMGELNPYQDIEVAIVQNNREATRRVIHTPMRVDGKTLIYEHKPETIFPASNEYRRFESVSNSFQGMNVDSLRYMGSNYHVWLKPDYPRSERQYSLDRTQHGRFMVREYNSTDSDIGADYITVHFMLDMPELFDKEVYLDGEFTHDRFDSYNRMAYDRTLECYTTEIPLKQGAYNYQYVVMPKPDSTISDTKMIPDAAYIEGNRYETENEYKIEVWFHPVGARADRLTGVQTITSR